MPKKLKRHSRNPDANQKKPHDHHYKSEAVSDKNRLFHHVKGRQNGVQQNVNVEVNIQPEEGCFEGIMKAIGGAFRR